MAKPVSPRQKLKNQLSREFMKAFRNSPALQKHGKKSQREIARAFVDYAAHSAPDRSHKALEATFSKLADAWLQVERDNLRLQVELARLPLTRPSEFLAPPGYKLVPEDPIQDSPAYGM